MIIITFDIPTGRWKALIPGEYGYLWLSFRSDPDNLQDDGSGTPIPDTFVSPNRALFEARLAIKNRAAPYRVEHTGITSNIEQVLNSQPLAAK